MIKLRMKNSLSAIKNKIVSRYLQNDLNNNYKKSTNINILLNRVKLDKKRESIKKIIFSAAASLGVLLFGIIIF
jgi:hypothetical protein